MRKALCSKRECYYNSFADLKTFQSDFSSGYLIGEILHRHGLQVVACILILNELSNINLTNIFMNKEVKFDFSYVICCKSKHIKPSRNLLCFLWLTGHYIAMCYGIYITSSP